jgi:hypothetical protein
MSSGVLEVEGVQGVTFSKAETLLFNEGGKSRPLHNAVCLSEYMTSNARGLETL